MNAKAQAALTKIGDLIEWLYSHLGDPRTKNTAIVVLTLMSLFGMIAPETATTLRNAVLGLL